MTCPPCTHDCNQGKNCPTRGKPYDLQYCHFVSFNDSRRWNFDHYLVDSCSNSLGYAGLNVALKVGAINKAFEIATPPVFWVQAFPIRT